jgi:hypothetical protein
LHGSAFAGQCSHLQIMMNKNIFFYTLSCLCFILLVHSCTDNELKPPTTGTVPEIDWRDDCPECPDDNDCCCAIQMISSAQCTIQICGALGGTTGPCPAPSGCLGSIVALNSSVIVFSAFDTREAFCALLSQGMWIRNLGPNTIVFDITCRADETAPPWINNITLMPGERINLQALSDCTLEPC